MAEKDIIARLKVEGQVDFINSMNQSADAVGKATKSIDGLDEAVEELGDTFDETDKSIALMAKEMDELTTELIKAIKSGKGVNEAVKKLETSIDNASESIVKMSKDSSDAYKLTSKLNEAFNEARKGSDKLTKGLDGTTDGLENITKFLSSMGKGVDDLVDDVYDLGASFEDIYGNLKPLTSRLGEMEDRMYELALAGKQNTDEFKALNAEAIRFRKTQIEVDKAVDALADSGAGIRAVSEGISGLAGAFAVSQGALALFGDENESLEKALIKLNAVMAISSGIQQVNENLLQKNAFTTKVAAAAQSAYALAVGTSTGAMKLFRIALIATGLGAIIVVIGAIIANWDKLSKAISESIPWLKNFGDAWTSVKDNFLAFVRSFGTIAVEIGKIALSLGKTIAQALLEPWKAGDLAKSFIEDVKKGLETISDTYDEQKGKVIENRLEQERIERVQKTILALETAILKARADNAKESAILGLQLQKARAELSLLVVGSNEYYEKQIEINGIVKQQNDLLKSNTQELQAQVGSLSELQKRYQEQIDIVNKSVEGSVAYNKALEKATLLHGQIEDQQTRINEKINEAKTLFEDWSKLFESIPEEKFEFDVSDFAEVMQMNIENEERLRDAQGKTFEERRKELDDLEAIEIGRAENIGAETTSIEEYYKIQREKLAKEESDYKKKLLDEERQKRIQAAEEALSIANTVGQATFGIFKQVNDAQKQILENRLKQGLISEEQYNREVAKLNEKQAKQDKARALFEATINGASAIVSAYRIGLPFAIVVGALVAAQIAAIAATPIPKFFKGVIGLKRGKNPKGRDTIPAMLNEGESVMTTEETKQHRPVLEAIRNKTFDKMYIRRGKMEQRTLSSIVNFSGSKKNKRLEKKMDMIYYQLENINSNTNMGASGTRQLNKYFKKRRNGSEFFV